jgi:hypothetical protein
LFWLEEIVVKIILVSFFSIFVIGAHAVQSVFIVDFLSNKESYIDKEIDVLGYVHTRGNSLGLYLTREYAKAYLADGVGQVPIRLNYKAKLDELPVECQSGYLNVTGQVKVEYGIVVLRLTRDTTYFGESEEQIFDCGHYKH